MSSSSDETRLRLTTGSERADRPFLLTPDSDARGAIAEELGLTSLRKLRFEGALRPSGGRDWVLDGQIGATVVQPCSVTLAPVTTRIDEPVTRRYLANWQAQDLPLEQEMPEEVEDEPMPAVLDLEAVMIEALSLAVPAFPRAEGVELGTLSARPKGAAPITETETKPLGGLADLLKDAKKDS
ncbi:YceD family protein [Palleronia caenipelagi]|uniref:DUF177 domain-containing protein n=1 Tax=Palleronia caenipelagi TaxID=2489174 RepID=A0A547PXQ6_9RHOB|nr:DUF177 domain-containing protein [Palleronia caenipelagi]TRD18943.1 DUF177 domain-containing protein [Palleronia caenipelagi]